MNDPQTIPPARREEQSLRFYIIFWLTAWTLLMAAIFLRSMHVANEQEKEIARVQARASWEKDIVYRRWNSLHGGVYAPVSEYALPNPYLAHDQRDLITTDGTELTMINPAYMTRQVHELGETYSGIRGKITSLDPIRPENKADLWETKALESFEEGEKEVSSIELVDGVEYLRLMRPLIVEKSCLQCHAQQGYQLGEIRGGISVTAPMHFAREITAGIKHMNAGLYSSIWAIGFLGLLWTGRSLTNKMRTQRKLEAQTMEGIRQKGKRLKDLVEVMPIGLALGRAEDMSITYANSHFCSMVGYRADELLQMTAADLHDEETNRIVRKAFDAMRKGTFTPLEAVPVKRKDGSVFLARIHNRNIILSGETLILALFEDVSPLHEAKELMAEALKLTEEALEEKTVFLRNMSHELRTPLNGIMGMADVLSATKLDNEQQELLEVIQTSGGDLLRLVSEILESSKLEFDGIEHVNEPFNPAELVSGLKLFFELDAQAKGLSLQTEVAENLPKRLLGDLTHIRQVVNNLISNAIKYTEEGGIEIEVGGEPRGEKKWLLKIRVKDSGIGIEPEAQERLFERFYQVDRSSTRKYGGVGLGLAICKHLIEGMEGDIRVQSTPGKGSEFIVTLPLEIDFGEANVSG